MKVLLAVTRGDVADYVNTLVLVYLVLIFIRIIMSWIPGSRTTASSTWCSAS